MENNGRGIFYGVIGVATLVVAMIGATFAYFSANISTENDPIAFNSAKIDLNLDQNTDGIKFNLIPVDETIDNFATGGYIGNKDSDDPHDLNCKDDDGNEFCSVYEVTVINPSKTTAQTVFARIDVATNDFVVNEADIPAVYEKDEATGEDKIVDGEKVLLTPASCSYLDETGESMYCGKTNVAFAVFKGTANDVNTKSTVKWNVDGSAVTQHYASSATAQGSTVKNALGDPVTTLADTTTTVGNVLGTPVLGKLGDMVVARTATKGGTESIPLDALSQTLAPEGYATYTIVMWLHENYEDQSDSEGKQFAAGITFATNLKGSGVTAVLAATQAAQPDNS